ncbi:hypothetical protein CHUAL_008670 [Chamberlinius hualienensis]
MVKLFRRNTFTLLKLAVVLSCCGVVFLLSRVLETKDEPNNSLKNEIPRDVPNVVTKTSKLSEESTEPDDIPVFIPKSKNKKDWHNNEQIETDKVRKGPGEQGEAVSTSPDEDAQKQELYKVNGFNAYVSDKIPLDRSLKDIRHKDCKAKQYIEDLPTVSVVVPFHNEHWTTLLRTAVTVLNRSPEHLIKEIILVDDGSTKAFLKEPLDTYTKEKLPKVKVLHSPKRNGLITARLMGAKIATGDVLIFLDSHSEANVNWLPPLLEPIAEDYRVAVCPFIDVIDYETFAYRAQDEGARGAFDWEFFYKRLPLLPEDREHPTEPFKSPIMAGGLFAISRKFFWELGGYDEGLAIWGGEQYELSFKIWQCGGQMFDAPCSRVGHIYRKFAPFPNPGIGDFVGKNYKRVADVWMDEYAEFLYKRRPHYRDIDPGDLTKQKAVREKWHCKSFKWFMENIAFDLEKHYPSVEPPNYAEGEIRNVHANVCIDTKFKGENARFGVDNCIKDDSKQSGEQQFALTWHKDIRPKTRNVCFDVSTSEVKAPVLLWGCHGQMGNQFWKYNIVEQWLIAGHHKKCLDCDPERKEVFVSDCDPHKFTQKWKFETVNATLLAELDKI